MSTVGSSFSCAKESLRDLLDDVHTGRIQIPEFQRDLDLTDDWVRSLLASVTLNYPIGALTLLEAGHPDFRFTSRPVPGVAATSGRPRRLLIDGQFRLAALHHALYAGTAPFHYIDVAAALDPRADRDTAILTRPRAEDSPRYFPLHRTFAEAAAPEFEKAILAPLRRYELPVITLGPELTRWTIRVHGGPDGPDLSDRFAVARP